MATIRTKNSTATTESTMLPTTTKCQDLDCERVTLKALLSSFRCIDSIELVVDNAKSSCPRRLQQLPSSLSREHSCRWGSNPSLFRSSSMENVKLPTRPSQEEFNAIVDEALEVSSYRCCTPSEMSSHNFIEDEECEDDSVDTNSGSPWSLFLGEEEESSKEPKEEPKGRKTRKSTQLLQ